MGTSKNHLAWIGATALIGSLRVFAADSVAPATELETITVTAQKRSESLQDVPLSITAIDARNLQQKAIYSFFDYGGKVPNLAFADTGDGSGTARTISIRGISGDGTTGFYIDETPVPDSIDPRIVDIQRIEVLRGPQGTLYGARSMGGTVRLITEQPNLNDADGRLRMSGGKTWNAVSPDYGVDGAFNVPLIQDTMALRAVLFFQHDAGFFTRRYLANPADAANLPPATNPTTLGSLPTATTDGVGRVNSYGGAVSLAIKPNNALMITPRIMYQQSKANGLLYADGGSYPVPVPATFVNAPNMHPAGYMQNRFFNLPERSDDAWTLASVGVKYEASAFAFLSSTSYFDRTVDETEDQSDFIWQNLLAPFDGIPLGDATNPNTPAYKAVPIATTIRELKQIHRFVQEFRFTSKLSGPWAYVAGIYFSDTRGRVPYAGYYPPSLAPGISQTGGFVVQGIPGLPIPVNPAIPDEIFGQDYQTRVSEPAIYGEMSYHFDEQWAMTVGLRGYRIKTQTGGYLEGIAFGGPRINDPDQSFTESGVNPKLGLDYKLSSDKLLYAQIARGFRPGGLVPSIPGNSVVDPLLCFQQLQALGYISASQTKSYKSDSLWNYELGAKTAWADNRVTLDGAVFLVKWNKIQQSVALPCGFQFRANSGAAEIKGAELEAHVRPAAGLDLSAGLGYQRARITEASALLPTLKVGDRVYQVPDWTGNASATYTVPLAETRSFVSTLSYSYTGDSVSASVNANFPRVRPSYNILDLRLAYDVGSYELALIGKNLTNVEANLGDNRSLAAETLGRPRLVVNPPRMIGAEFRMKF